MYDLQVNVTLIINKTHIKKAQETTHWQWKGEKTEMVKLLYFLGGAEKMNRIWHILYRDALPIVSWYNLNSWPILLMWKVDT